jgi:hypothetical protein
MGILRWEYFSIYNFPFKTKFDCPCRIKSTDATRPRRRYPPREPPLLPLITCIPHPPFFPERCLSTPGCQRQGQGQSRPSCAVSYQGALSFRRPPPACSSIPPHNLRVPHPPPHPPPRYCSPLPPRPLSLHHRRSLPPLPPLSTAAVTAPHALRWFLQLPRYCCSPLSPPALISKLECSNFF